MPAITFIAPILPSREEEWRRFVQEVAEVHLREYEGLRRRLGLRNESVWLVRTKKGEPTAMVYLETEDPERIVTALVTSEKPFDLWFKGKLLEFHGAELTHIPRRSIPELIFSYWGVRGSDSGFHEGKPWRDVGDYRQTRQTGDGHSSEGLATS